MRVEGPPRCRASLFRLDRPEHPELRMRALIILYLVCRCRAVINVPVPARDAKRYALVQFIFRRVRAGRVHQALQLVFLQRSSPVEQSRWLGRVETEISLPSVGL